VPGREISKRNLDDAAQLRAVLDSAVDGVITIDERGIIEAANPAAEKLFGYTVSEMVGRRVNMLMPSPYREEHDGYLANYCRTGERRIIGIGREAEGRRKDGSTFPLYLAVSEVSLGHRRVFTGFVHDLTDLRRVEEQATQLGRILDESLNEIFIFDAETLKFLLVNRGALSNIGYSAEEMSRLAPFDIEPGFSAAQFRNRIKPLLSDEKSVLQFETVHERRNGSIYDVDVRLQKTKWEQREAFVATVIDITEHKRTQKQLAKRDVELEFMVEHLPAAAAYVDTRNGKVRFNQVVEEITGYTASELTTVDECFVQLFGKRAATVRSQYEQYQQTWTDDPLRLQISRKDGAESVVEFRGYRYDDHEIWLVNDVTARDRQETELRIRERAIQAANEGIVIADATREGHPIIFVNRAFEILSGYSAEEFVGHGCELLCSTNPEEDSREKLRAAIANEEDFLMTVRCVRKDGPSFWNEISIAPVKSADGGVTHIVAVMEDVSDRRQAQEIALQSERLAAIGQMVTGLAHESRNALQRAQACLDMLALDLEDQPEQLELTEKTRRALQDLYRHYEEVRNYAAPINLQRRPTDLARLWRSTWTNLEEFRFGRDFQLIEASAAEALVCSVDDHRIEQVFRNIMENALAACPDPGTLTITCDSLDDEGRESVRISFQDNGPGINIEASANVFQPFFTTKQKGTGLGMAISKRIIDAHGGRIELGAPSTSGAEVIVILPARP
jgi:two-component system, LuxR family, sensor kinase FixL